MRRFLIAVLGVALIGGTFTAGAVAQSYSVPQAKKIAKACTTPKHVLVLKSNGTCPGTSQAATLPLLGGPGAILGYAHVNPDGTLDAANSWKVKAANYVENSTGFYCFKGFATAPHGAQVTLDYDGTANGKVYVVTSRLNASASHCGADGYQVEVFTGVVNTSTFAVTTGTDVGYYIVFY